MNGDVFIVARGGQNFKLGLVEVRFVPEAQFLANISPKVKDAEARMATLVGTLAEQDSKREHLEQLLVESEGQLSKVNELATRAARAGADRLERECRELASKIEAGRRDFQKVHDELATARTNLLAEIQAVKQGCGFADDLTPAAVATKTDADGKFSVKLKPGKYATVATARRLAGDETEVYCWLVWSAVTGEAEKREFLSNDNLAETKCATCIQLPALVELSDVEAKSDRAAGTSK